jgi:isopropylmalate/homocitrate/citramalate synthase
MDTTLRDGNKPQGIFSAAEKLTITIITWELNVDRIEIASARVSEESFKA